MDSHQDPHAAPVLNNAVPVRHPGRWISAIIIVGFLLAFLQSLFTNPNFRWDVVGTYILDTKVVQGVVWTLVLTFASMVLAIKNASEENRLMFWIRKKYYRLVNQLSSIETFENFTGFGLYDRKVVEAVRTFDDPYPYFRGMIAEIGLPHCQISYDQPKRKRGITKNNFYTLYDLAMLGITNLSKVPLRLVTALGFASSLLSLLAGVGYFFYKLLFWTNFTVGIAPLVIGLFFLGSVQLLSMGILGEYVGSIHTQVQKRPYVIEKERINFEHAPSEPLQDAHWGAIARTGGISDSNAAI